MNLRNASTTLRIAAFRAARSLARWVPGGRIEAIGVGRHCINAVLVLNLDRQPTRWRRVLGELGRFRTAQGLPLTCVTRRFAAIDALDGRAVAATADVDPIYRIRDQLFVQPNASLAECFGPDELIRMTRQEIAVARSHIEAWKTIAAGSDEHVLVLEDDVWFKRGAAGAIDRGWRAALGRCSGSGPKLLYLSYNDADGTATRVDVCDALFHPKRGLWFLSGYVLSRSGAETLLRAMPVVGPVDLWINRRFSELGALALTSPVILQREDGGSDNSYSILPYLARAGIVDASAGDMRPRVRANRIVLAFTRAGETEHFPMALSMLGLRVRAFDGCEDPMSAADVLKLGRSFDALINPPLDHDALEQLVVITNPLIIFETGADTEESMLRSKVPEDCLLRLSISASDPTPWTSLCSHLGLVEPAEAWPSGVQRNWRAFRDDRGRPPISDHSSSAHLDDSPWVLPAQELWRPRPPADWNALPPNEPLIDVLLDKPNSIFRPLKETFPGNLATFTPGCIRHGKNGAELIASSSSNGLRPYQSGAFASTRSFLHGRIEAEIKAAPGAGLITGFFLHRTAPRQEIDVELLGNDPTRMLVNVFFNPGDEGAAINFGYRGSPCYVELGFDATQAFHNYAVDWRPGRITWLVDGKAVHERVSWDPTPIPHLPMRLHANLWISRSEELVGQVSQTSLPAIAIFRRISVWS